MNKITVCLLCLLLLTGCGRDTQAHATQSPAPHSTETQTAEPTQAPTRPAPENAPGLMVFPLPASVDPTGQDCTLSVSLEEGGFFADDSGVCHMQLTVYDYELFDMADIARLNEGDTVFLRGQPVAITQLQRTDSGAVSINGGLDMGGYELIHNDSTVYFETQYSDHKVWQPVAGVVLPVAEDFVFTDASDPEGEPVRYGAEAFLAGDSSLSWFFVPENTTVTVTGGRITAMERRYIP